MFDWINRLLNNGSRRGEVLIRSRTSRGGMPRYGFRTGRFASAYGKRSELHYSLILTMLTLSIAVLAVSSLVPDLVEIRSAALTLPLIWFVSLLVRVATQQLAIGEYSHDLATTLCPSGNMETDYEFLPRKAMLAYGVSGQLASLGLMSIGLVVHATLAQPPQEQISMWELLDFRGGWGSDAWATQIFWVNLFLMAINALPTVPFDSRALVLCFFCWRNQSTQNPQVFRSLGSFDSHLAATLFGVGSAFIVFGLWFDLEVAGWYAALAAAAYAFVASQWEYSRAADLEEQYTTSRTHSRVRRGAAALQSHLEFELDTTSEQDLEGLDLIASQDTGFPLEFHEDPSASHGFQSVSEAESFEEAEEGEVQSELLAGEVKVDMDIDEILRKLHREGPDSLTEGERQALLTASRQINQRRGSC